MTTTDIDITHEGVELNVEIDEDTGYIENVRAWVANSFHASGDISPLLSPDLLDTLAEKAMDALREVYGED